MDKIFELPTVGEILTQEFLEPLNITPYRLAKDLGVSTSTILDLVHGKRNITVEMSLRLSKYFGTTSKFWLNMQNELDLRTAQQKMKSSLEKIFMPSRILQKSFAWHKFSFAFILQKYIQRL